MVSLADPTPSLNVPQSVVQSPDTDPRTTDASEYLDRLREYAVKSLEQLRAGQIRALDSDFASLERQLDGLTDLRIGWDGYGASIPTKPILRDARRILRKLQEELVKPQQVSASAEGGVAFSFKASGGRRAQIEILNDGETYAHLYDLLGNSYTHEWRASDQDTRFNTLLEPILNYLQS